MRITVFWLIFLLSSTCEVFAINDIPAGSSFLIQGSAGNGHVNLSSGGFQNAGTLIFESADGGYSSSLTLTTGALTNLNSGVININPGTGGDRTISGDLYNFGAFNVIYSLNFAPNHLFEQDGGTLNMQAGINLDGIRFHYGGGAVIGTTYLVNSSLSLNPAAAPVITFIMTGAASTLTSDIGANQTIWLQGNGRGSHSTLTDTNGFLNAGTLQLESRDGGYASDVAVTSGVLTNIGAINVNQGTGGERFINANLLNLGILNANFNMGFTKDNGAYVNAGTVKVASGMTLRIDAGNQVFTQRAGTLGVDGLFYLSNARFSFEGGTITGTPYLVNATLNISSGLGTGLLIQSGPNSVFTGNIYAGQTVWLRGDGTGSHSTLTGTNGFLNAGTLQLESRDGGYASDVAVTSGVLTNIGAINVNQGTGGERFINANLLNLGTLNANFNMGFAKDNGAYVNAGTVKVASGMTLRIDGGNQVFTQRAGTLGVDGLFYLSNARFSFEGGTIIGTPYLVNATLNISSGLGTGLLIQSGPNSVFTGNIYAGQTVWLRGDGTGSHSTLTAANGFQNAGTLQLESSDGGYNSNFALNNGFLTNAVGGIFEINPGSGGPRNFAGSLLNRGTFNVNYGVTFSKTNAIYENRGIFNVATNQGASIDGQGQVFNQASGTLNIYGFLTLAEMTMNYTGGLITGTPYLLNSLLNLYPAGTNSGTFILSGPNSQMSGDIQKNQVVWLQGNGNGSHSLLTATNGFRNSGTLRLESRDGGYTSDFTMVSGTFTNTVDGSVIIGPGLGGERLFAASVLNQGTFNVKYGATLGTASGAFVNDGALVLDDNTSVSFPGAFTQVSGLTRLAGGALNLSTPLTIQGGTIAGSGAISSSVTNNAVISPGTSAAPGALNIANGSYTQTAAGSVEADLFSGGADQISVSGNAYLNGRLVVRLASGFAPADASQYAILRAQNVYGRFSSFDLPALPSGRSWQIQYDNGQVTLLVSSGLGSGSSRIKGSVADTSGQPVANARVFVFSSTYQGLTNGGSAAIFETLTDANGAYQISVTNDTWTVGINNLGALGFGEGTNQTVTVSAGDVTVNFIARKVAASPITISALLDPAGSGAVVGTGSFPSGSSVTLGVVPSNTALPWQFLNWTEAGLVQSTEASYTFIASRDRQLIAHIALPSFQIAAQNNPLQGGVVVGAGRFTFGTTNTLTATVNPGFQFRNWTRNGAVIGTSPVLALVVKADDVVAANYDQIILSLGLGINPGRIIEGTSATGTLARQGSTGNALTVNLAGPLAQLSFPSTVTIPPGHSNIVFAITSVDDSTPAASRTNTFTASADGFVSTTASLIVDDNDVPGLAVRLTDRTVSEGAGPQATTGVVTRDRPSPRALTVTLTSGNPSAAQVPATVTIPAGSTNGIFNVSVTDNTVVDGTRTVVIGAALVDGATGLTLASAPPEILTITDDDGPSLRLDIALGVVGEGLSPATTAIVTRNTGTNSALTVSLSSSATTHATVPATLTIPAGALSATFPIASISDGVTSGNQVVVISASAPGFAPSAKTIVVTDTTLPDLVVTALKTPAGLTSDTSFNLSFRLENHGLAATGTNFLQRIVASADALPSADDQVLLETTMDASIPAGLFVEQTLQMRAPSVPGDYYIIVITDADNRIAEILESNNTAVTAQPVHVGKAYQATVTTDVTVAAPNTPVPLHGKATLASSGAPAAFVPVDIMIRLRDTERHIGALTDSAGAYATTFQPLPGEGGSYTVAADYPGVTNSPAQASFSLIGISVDRVVPVRVAEGTSATLTTALHNLANVPLSQLQAIIVSNAAGVTATATLSTNALSGDADASLGLVLTAADQAKGGVLVVRVSSAEGASADFVLPITIESARPRLVATPDTLEAGMRRGGQTTVQIGITNAGGRATGPLNVLAPAAPWLKVSSGTQVPALAPGEGTVVSILLTPPSDLDLGPYAGSIVINSTNTSLSVPFTFRNLSDNFGSLRIETVDEYTYYAAGSPKLTNAAVRILDSVSKQVVTTNATGPDGILFLPSLQEAYYDLEISADGHSSYKNTLLVQAGKTNQVSAFLSRQTVRYIFSVVPTDVEDRTRIDITTTFETFVPIPVLTVDPVYFDLSGWSGSVTQVNVTLMNHGLLAAQNVRLALPDDPNVEFTSLVTDFGSLAAQSSVTVPVVIKKRLAGQVSASGKIHALATGGSCYQDASFSFDLVCGPQVNTYNVPLRFDKLPGCPAPLLTFTVPYFAPFNYTGSGAGGGGSGGGCPDCFSGGVPQLFSPPRDVAPPNNCNPCLLGLGQAIYKCAKVLPPAKGAACVKEAATCAWGLRSGVTADAIRGCLGNAGSCLGGALGSALQIPGCIQPAGACFGSGGTKSKLKTQSSSDSVDPNIPGDAQPLFRQLDRALAFVATVTNLFGSNAWFEGVDDVRWSNFFSAFSASIALTSPLADHLSPAEIDQLVALPYPSDSVTSDEVKRFAARWNRSLDYYQQGIFNSAQVPSGQSLDFIDTSVASTIAGAALAANDAAVADGYSDPLTAVYEASQEYLAKVSSAGGGSCAHVKLLIEQEAVITRDGFNATLEIANDTDDQLSGVSVELTIRNAAGEDSTSLFAIQPATLNGISAVDGTGLIAAHSSGKASWILIPTSDAAPDGPVTHVVGGALRYQQGGIQITVPLTPSSINVLPNASLSLKYFHQRDVFADDPFTDVIEPSIPYSLAVMVQNSGKGTARNLRISSAQPKIVDNQKGLLIDFKIIATEVAGQSLSPSLTADFGDIPPGQIKIGRWLLQSSLQGLFTDYSATFEHLDGLGDKRLSLIQSVEIHEMDHVVQAGGTFEDGLPDFLANDVPDLNDYPDTLHLSQGTTMPVLVVTNATVDAPVSAGHLTVTLNASMPAGWGYLRVLEPANGSFQLKEVRRPDNTVIPFNTNVWTTDRTFIGFSQKPVRENVLHLLDYNSGGSYRLLYAPLGPADITPPSSSVAALPPQSALSIPVNWSGSDGTNGTGIAYYDIYVSVNGGAFTPWLQKTTDTGAIYPGVIGGAYAFYSVATDLAGNREAAPANPDAQTSVSIVNTAPALTVSPAVSIDEGALVTLINTAVDLDVPAQTLTWSLEPSAPASAQISPSSGVVTWQTTEASGPSTNLFTIVVRDNGQPALSATGTVAVIVREVNVAPVIEGTTNRVMDELQTLRYQAVATDADLPTNSLTFSLVAPPAGAAISASGSFIWTPNRLQGPSTNLIQIKVTDNGVPPLSATQAFTVVVRDSEGDFDISADSMVTLLEPGMSGTVSLNSGLDLTDISFELDASSDRLRDITIEPLIPEIASATLTPASSTAFHVRFTAAPGDLLQGNRPVARLNFSGGTNAHSEIVVLSPENVRGTRSTGQAIVAGQGLSGRLVLIGLEPLLAAGKGSPVSLTLFGIPSHTYTLEQGTNTAGAASWKSILQYKQTSPAQSLSISTNSPLMFYRLREN